MKNILLFTFLLFSLSAFSQFHFGKTKSQIKDIITESPLCSETESTLMFCSSSGNKVMHFFINNRCVSVGFHTVYSSKYKAKIALEKEINKFARENNETPIRKDNMSTTFFKEGVFVYFSFIETNSTYYVKQTFQPLETDEDYAEAYRVRGDNKYLLEDYNGAIADYSKAIELDPNYAEAYMFKGQSSYYLRDFYGAIADLTKAIELDPNNAKAYRIRGFAKIMLSNSDGACADWKIAAKYDDEVAAKMVAEQCN